MSDNDDEDEPSAKSARVVVGIIIVLVALFAIIMSFLVQTTLIRAMEFGCALVEFVLGIVVIVL
jgi:hypothetical protein